MPTPYRWMADKLWMMIWDGPGRSWLWNTLSSSLWRWTLLHRETLSRWRNAWYIVLEKPTVAQSDMKFPTFFWGKEGTLPCSKEPATGPYPKSDESIPHSQSHWVNITYTLSSIKPHFRVHLVITKHLTDRGVMKSVSNKTNKQSINTTYIVIIATATRYSHFNSHHWAVEENEMLLHMNDTHARARTHTGAHTHAQHTHIQTRKHARTRARPVMPYIFIPQTVL